MQNEAFSYQQNYTGRRPRKKLFIVLAIILAIGILGYVSISAYIVRQNTGILQINLSGKSATITAQTATSQVRKIGAKSRLAPGTYQIVATSGERRTATTVTIAKKQTTNIALNLQPPTRPAKIYGDTAQNIFATSSQLYYLNAAGQYLSSYFLGTEKSQSYLPNIAPVFDVYWLSATRFFYQTTGNVWKYYENGNSVTLHYNDEKPLPDTISFNKNGAVAFVTDLNRLVSMTSPTAQPKQIGSTATQNVQTSIAPDGTVALSTPDATFGKVEATKLYKGGTARQTPTNLNGATNITWAPDSSKFSYVTMSGMFVYSLSGELEQVAAVQPTNPLSAAWFTSTKLLYVQNSSVMQYIVAKSHSVKLAEVLGILHTNDPLTLSSDGQRMYMGVARDSEGHSDMIYSFLPGYANLSQSEIAELLSTDIQQANAKLLKNLPHRTLRYDLKPAVSASDELVVNTQIFIPPGFTGDEAAKISTIKQEIDEYLRSVGANAANYRLEYEIIHQTLNGV